MEYENDYKVIITHEGVLVFLIKERFGEPDKSFLLYDGGYHATFYRRADETVLFDYLDSQIIPILRKSDKVVVFELSDASQDVSRDYEVSVKHIKKNAFTDSL